MVAEKYRETPRRRGQTSCQAPCLCVKLKLLGRAQRPWHVGGEVALVLSVDRMEGREASLRETLRLVGGEGLVSGVELGTQGLIWAERLPAASC